MVATRRRQALTAAAAVLAAGVAVARRWTADDAFISFRYAQNLVEGHGLVFNAGERVEGYTNFLWTLLCSLGLALGFDAEPVAHALGVSCYAGLVLWLGLFAVGRRQSDDDEHARSLPLAALAAASHPDLWTHATSGLETALFCLLSVAGLSLSTEARSRRERMLAGALLGACVLTRPDGALFVATAAAGVWLRGRRRFREAAELVTPTLLLVAAHVTFRIAYYGELLPNTFFAKSAAVGWYDQGLVYLYFFVRRSWALLIALGVALYCLRGAAPAVRHHVRVLLSSALLYTAYVVHVGGDFMFGRMLVVVFVLAVAATERAVVGRVRLQWTTAAVLIVGCALTPLPNPNAMWARGIVDERTFPDPERNRPGRAAVLRRYLDGLDARVAFTGGDARLVYRARIPIAIESETGLTDTFVARQPLPERRGRVGHEKHAPLEYLIRERKVHFVVRSRALSILRAREKIPLVPVNFDGVIAYCLRWDAELMAAIGRRGARFDDFPKAIDKHMAELPRLTDLEVRRLYARLELFYFAHNPDARRQEPFLARLGAVTAEGAPR